MNFVKTQINIFALKFQNLKLTLEIINSWIIRSERLSGKTNRTNNHRKKAPPANTTRHMDDVCSQPALVEQEQRYLKALEQAATYELDEDTLVLRGVDGTLMVSYRALKKG